MANPAVVVDFVANTKELQKGFDQATGKAGGFASKLGGLAKTGALAGLAALTGAVKVGVEEFSQAAKVTAQTNAVLKSTGEVAGVSAGDVDKLASSLMKKSGIDDEAIKSGENLLLTFTNVRNEAGKGNDIFNQATATMTDMSVALGQDMKTSATQLGKALNDPIKGVGALSRVGVTFTAQQKKQIEALVESGDTLGAQKIILGELNKEFGGSAEAAGKTLPGQLSILKESFSNVAGELISRLVPVLQTVFGFLADHQTTVLVMAGLLGTLAAVMIAVTVATAAWSAVTAIASAATAAWTAVQAVFNAVMALNPVALVVIAIVALVAAIVLAYKKSETFRKIVTGAFDAVLEAVKAVFGWVKKNWPLLLAILTGPIGLAVLAIVRNWDKIKTAAAAAFNAVRDTVTTVIGAIKRFLTGLATWIADFAKGVFGGAMDKLKDAFGLIVDGARVAWDRVKKIWGGAIDFFKGLGRGIANAAVNIFKGPLNAIISLWNALRIPGFEINIKTPKFIPDIHFKWGGLDLPDIPKLAAGGIVTRPTLAMIGESGPEAVIPLTGSGAGTPVEVRVFIGDVELRNIVRTEVVDANTGLARTLLAGAS